MALLNVPEKPVKLISLNVLPAVSVTVSVPAVTLNDIALASASVPGVNVLVPVDPL